MRSPSLIPNTGEYLEFQVLLKLNSETGYGIDLPKYLKTGNYQLSIDPPTDRRTAPDSLDDETSNIVKNRGTGFELALKPKNGFNEEKPEKFALFNNDAGTYEALSTSGLILDRDGLSEKLSVKKDATSGWYILCYDKQPCTFGIRPLVTGIRPGDDLFMSVSIKKKDEDDTVTSLFASTPVDDSYLAVYDKKMLWRANLYIKETNPDWNDTYSWNAPPDATVSLKDYPAWGKDGSEATWVWGYNEWNRVYQGTTAFNLKASGDANNCFADNATFMTDLDPGDGCQVVTPLHDSTWTNNALVRGSVTYSLECHDSPFEYGSKLWEQRGIIEYGIRNNKYGFTGGSEQSTYTDTRAPETKASPYIGAGNDWTGQWASYVSSVASYPSIDERDYYPYVPGYSSNGGDIQKSAGVDCVGLVQRSASYAGQSYILKDLKGYYYETSTPRGKWEYGWWRQTISVGYIDVSNPQLLWKIAQYNETKQVQEPDGSISDVPLNLELLIPGDFIYYPGHIMMVASVGRGEDGEVRSQDVKIIEATWGAHGNDCRGSAYSPRSGSTYSPTGMP